MSTLTIDIHTLLVQDVMITGETLTVELVDGRAISAPLAWYPRIVYSTPQERKNWRLIGKDEGIHWPDMDEDISVENLIAGKPSGESQRSLKKWLDERAKKGRNPFMN
jgi:hypothetical protein